MNAGSRGMTLVEIIIAMSILVFAILALLSSLNLGIILDSNSRERAQALARATVIMEDVQSEAWDDIDARDGETFSVEFDTTSGVVELEPTAGLSLPGSVAVDATSAADLKRVKVTVSWKAAAGHDQTLVLSGFVGRSE